MLGNYIEPTSDATIAGLGKYIEGSTAKVVVSVYSGHSLKYKEFKNQNREQLFHFETTVYAFRNLIFYYSAI